jgi:signal peptidase I
VNTEQRVIQASPRMGDRVWREALSWFWVLIAFVLIEGTLGQARVIPSASMENTLLIGDHLIVSRFGYDAGLPFTSWHVPLWRNPRRQQVVIFRAPLPGSPDFVKRVIGEPGDKIAIKNGMVYVNDQPLNEPYVVREATIGNSVADNYPPTPSELWRFGLLPDWAGQIGNYVHDGELVVPQGRYFVMGDNRDNSYDSRFWGFVPRSSIVGTPLFVYMSIDAPEEVWEPGHIGERFTAYLNAVLHPHEVRWRRLFSTF